MLSIKELNSFFGRSHVLHDISLEVGKGEVTSILGRNGVGKTTLLKTLMGLSDRVTGEINLQGRNIASSEPYARARSGIAYVPQGREIIPDFTVRENILMGGFARAGGKPTVLEIVIELFPYLRDNMERSGGLLSGGQQQQLAIARALAADPGLLLLDEPNEGIQPSIVEEIEQVIFKLNRDLGLTVILVEQNVRFAREVSHRFAMMEKGRIVAEGPTTELTDDLVHEHMTV